MAAISGGGARRPKKPAPVPVTNLDAMIAESLKDIPSDDEGSGRIYDIRITHLYVRYYGKQNFCYFKFRFFIHYKDTIFSLNFKLTEVKI